MARRKPWGPFEKRVRATKVCPAGYGHERLAHAHSHLEKLFRLAWQAEHRGPMHGASTSCDLLFNLLQPLGGPTDRGLFRVREQVTARDRKVAATVIQWLGTNVGRCFLHAVLSKSKDTWPTAQMVDEAVRGRYGTLPLLSQDKRPRLRGERRAVLLGTHKRKLLRAEMAPD